MHTAWLIDVPAERKQETIDAIKHSTIALRQIKKFVERQIKDLDHTSLADYDNPSWSHLQADRLGQLRAYRKLLEIIPTSQ